MNKIQQYKQILEQAPEGATHYDGKNYFRFEMYEHGQAYLILKSGVWSRGLPAYPVYSCQLLSDLQKIVDQAETIERLKDGLNKEVLEFVRCGIGSNYGGKFYEDKINSVYEPLKTLLKEQ